MANQLDELNDPIMEEGRDVNVIAKRVEVKVGVGSTIFQVMLWILGIIPGIIFTIMKVKAANYFRQLEQKLQHDASQIDNYLEQRVMILQNAAQLVDKAVDLDKDTFSKIAQYRGGGRESSAEERNEVATQVENISRNINVAFENYPDLKAHKEIADAMQQNSYLQREITAAREVYNDSINRWNQDIMVWPTKMIVAAKAGYTTRIPFATTKEIKQQARGTFFGTK